MDFKTLILIFPIIFMIHDFEEIIFFKKWITRNENELKQRFPKFSAKFLPHFKNLSTSSFALGVAKEFIIVSLISLITTIDDSYFKLWYGIFIGFFIHIIIHIIQWIIYRKYIPSIVTSFMILPFGVYTIQRINDTNVLEIQDKIVWGIIGFILVILNLLLVHKFIAKYNTWR